MNREAPERLIHSALYSDELGELKRESLSDERLAKSLLAIKQAPISSVAEEAIDSGLQLAKVFKLTLVVALAGGLYWVSTPEVAVSVPGNENLERAPEREPAVVVEKASSPESAVLPKRSREVVELTVPVVDKRVPQQDGLKSREAPNVAKGVVEKPKPAERPKAKPKPTPQVREARLAESLKLYQRAQADKAAGQLGDALAALEPLLEEGVPLRAEAFLLSAQILYLEGEYTQALSRLREILEAGKIASEKRAELERFLGDVLVKQGKCGGAIMAYKRALKLGVSSQAEEAIGRAIRGCGEL